MNGAKGTFWRPDKTMFYGALFDISAQPVGSGGFGLVYKAEWRLATHSTVVAIKVPRSAEELQQRAGEGTPKISLSSIIAVSWQS